MSHAMVDDQGYRLGVGMILANQAGRLFLGCRTDAPEAWQFPQGGIHQAEPPLTAMYRELMEEVGLTPAQVEVLASARDWHQYALPTEHRVVEGRRIVGQKQRWYLLRLLVEDSAIHLGRSGYPEFCRWRWADYWEPVAVVIPFKRPMYQQLLTEFAPYLGKEL